MGINTTKVISSNETGFETEVTLANGVVIRRTVKNIRALFNSITKKS
ncbi:MAG: hypothetical protein PHZ26_05220 [Candidatus Gracilibacteria bacterium]|nr:hypothetical protein [Candidatus Gracilibacteria bacterium]MDD2909118.1 hypothetical protein [Candidatus Gracilibacteria bacterium]